MRAQKVLAKDFQFYFADLDNIILVESHEDEAVTIRASKNNVPEGRKIFFIRKLAAEGFIPDHYQWFSGSTDGLTGVLWVKDYSWLKTHQVSKGRANRFMCRSLVASCILLVAMLRVLAVSAPPGPASDPLKVTSLAVDNTVPGDAITGRVGDSLVLGHPLSKLKKKHETVTRGDSTGNPPLRAAVLE
jgi:hypothetical protein